MAIFIDPKTGRPGSTQNQVNVGGRPTLPSQLQPIRPQPQPQPTRGVSQPRPQPQPQPYNPFVGGGPGRGPQVQPGGGGGMGGMIRMPPGLGQQVGQPLQNQPPTFNLPSPVPVLGGPGAPQPQPTLNPPNLNTTPGQTGNMPIPIPVSGVGIPPMLPSPVPGQTGNMPTGNPMPQPAGPLGSAPPTLGSDVGPPGWALPGGGMIMDQSLKTAEDWLPGGRAYNMYGGGMMNQPPGLGLGSESSGLQSGQGRLTFKDLSPEQQQQLTGMGVDPNDPTLFGGGGIMNLPGGGGGGGMMAPSDFFKGPVNLGRYIPPA